MVGFLVGICTVFFDVSYQSYLPSLVERDQLIDGNSKLEISRSAAQIGGPGLRRRARRRSFTAPVRDPRRRGQLPRLAASSCLGIRRREATPEPTRARARRSRACGRSRRRACASSSATRTCSAQAVCTGTSNFFSSSSFAILIVFLVRELHMSPGVIGVIVLGRERRLPDRGAHGDPHLGARRRRADDRSRRRAALGAGDAAHRRSPAGDAAIPFLVVAAHCWSGSASSSTTSSQVSFRQAICPPRIQGRMNSVMRFMVWGTIPLGALSAARSPRARPARRRSGRRRDRRRASPSSGSCSRRSAACARCRNPSDEPAATDGSASCPPRPRRARLRPPATVRS